MTAFSNNNMVMNRDLKLFPGLSPAEAFLRAGGDTIVVKARKREPIDAVTRVEVLARARTGRRQVLVLRPLPGEMRSSEASAADGAARRRAAP